MSRASDDVLAVGQNNTNQCGKQFVSFVLILRPIGRTGRLEPAILRRLLHAAAR
ncbi:hypothetical protein SAMN05443247_08278 [Bradyrhizobium erythrophlei]|jgi:hypothetical protein|nr:hypothetical protein SAMN05443247_08278 [Bradyrhizobium erythrophlei]